MDDKIKCGKQVKLNSSTLHKGDIREKDPMVNRL